MNRSVKYASECYLLITETPQEFKMSKQEFSRRNLERLINKVSKLDLKNIKSILIIGEGEVYEQRLSDGGGKGNMYVDKYLDEYINQYLSNRFKTGYYSATTGKLVEKWKSLHESSQNRTFLIVCHPSYEKQVRETIEKFNCKILGLNADEQRRIEKRSLRKLFAQNLDRWKLFSRKDKIGLETSIFRSQKSLKTDEDISENPQKELNKPLCNRGGSFAWNPDSQNHDYLPYRIMKKGLLLKCEICRLAYIIPRSNPAFPRQYNKVFSKADYLKIYPGHPTNWVDPGPGEKISTPIKKQIEPTTIWKRKGFDPNLEAPTRAYFNAFLDACRNNGLVFGEDSGLYVCAPPELLPEMTKSLTQAMKVHIIPDFETFIESMPNFSHFTSQLGSLLKESGAAAKIREIDKIFGLN